MRKLAMLAVVLLLIPVVALADGGIIPDHYTHMYEPEQKAIIVWNGPAETMVLATKISAEDFGNMAWIVPVRSSVKPEVAASDVSVFWEFIDYFVPPIEEGSGFGWGAVASKSAGGVEVVDIKKVDIYDVTVLKTTDAKSLIDWLNANGYYVSPEYAPIFGRYVGNDGYFIANRIDLKNKHAAAIAEVEKFNSSFENLTLGDQMSVLSDLIYRGNLSDTGNLEALSWALRDLKSGMSTPLKITFSPAKLSYPLVISSLSNGSTVFTGDYLLGNVMKIEVYVVSSTVVKDSNGILQFNKALGVTDSLRSNVKEHVDLGGADVVTRLTYFGGADGLTADAEFVPCPECSVGNVDVDHVTAEALPMVLIFVVLFGAVSLVFSPAFALGLAAMYVRAKKYKKLLGWKGAAVMGYVAGALASVVLLLDFFVGTPLIWVLAFHAVATFCLTAFLGGKWKNKYFAFIAAYLCASLLTALLVVILFTFLFPLVF